MTKPIIEQIFALGVFRKNCQDLIPLAKKLYIENKKDLHPNSDLNHNTTLKGYLGTKSTLKGSTADLFHNQLLIAAEEFLEVFGYMNLKPNINASWLTEMDNTGAHNAHIHYGMHISGCFYIELPENSNIIEFTSPFKYRPPLDIKEYNIFNSPAYVIRPEQGDILLWESSLVHSVPVLQFTGNRLTLAFDIICERNQDA